MNPFELLLWSAPALGLTVGLAFYVRHVQRRLYRELRHLREATNTAVLGQRQDEVRAQATHSADQATMTRLEPIVTLQEVLRAAQEVQSRLETATAALTALPLMAPKNGPDLTRPLQRLQTDLEFVKNRLSSYLGEGTALTHLVDETPIYINTADIGCPANFINGGRYEEEYLQVLASFCRPDAVFLDVGANLGVFSLRLAPYLRQGRLLAFEPNARIRELFARSVHLNGLRERVDIFAVGASDETAELVLEEPEGHAGGGHVVRARPDDLRLKIRVQPLDELLVSLPAFHIAKIDVEGHELHVLRGMRKLLARSPDAVVLFEKLMPNAGLEEETAVLFAEFGMVLWRIDGVRLEPVTLDAFRQGSAYFLAARPATIGHDQDRGFVRIAACNLMGPLKHNAEGYLVQPDTPVAPGGLLFHGPYWYLPRGVHRVTIEGTLFHPLRIQVTEKFGYAVADVTVSGEHPEFDFVADRDLTHFELVGRAGAEQPAYSILALRVRRIA
jgi:FkbM family methyltransferase